jgi:hypothetical protein
VLPMQTMPPTSDQQIGFLVNLQRLLDEGLFVATYKFALLLSLADLSIELGDDSGGPLTLATVRRAQLITLLLVFPAAARVAGVALWSTHRTVLELSDPCPKWEHPPVQPNLLHGIENRGAGQVGTGGRVSSSGPISTSDVSSHQLPASR